jgi:hypothetical protein
MHKRDFDSSGSFLIKYFLSFTAYLFLGKREKISRRPREADPAVFGNSFGYVVLCV